MSTIKEVFFPATILSTLSSELMSGTWAGRLEPGPRHWNKSCRAGLGFWGEVEISPGVPGCPCRHSTLQVWEVGNSPGVPGRPWRQSIFQCPLWPQVGHAFVGGRGFGQVLPSVLTGCIGSRVWRGRVLSPGLGLGRRLISSLSCCCQKGIFHFSLTVFFSLSLLLSIIEHLEGHF